MSLYPTRDGNFTKATERRLQNDSRKHVYGSQSDSLLVSQSYPELAPPKSKLSNTSSYTNSPTKHHHKNTVTTPYWSAININNYTIIKKIGSGTYGSVFHGRSPNSSDVAIKQLCPMQNDKHLVDGFHITAIREIKILKSLHHTNIISLNDVICCKENIMSDYIDPKKKDKYSKFAANRMQTYMIFEYMHHDLSGLLHNDNVKFNIKHIKYFLCQILNALEYCHETALILHRDIKSSNLLVDNRGVVKIADFGLARQFIPALACKHKRIANVHASVNNNNIIHPRHYTNRVVTLWYRSPELLLSDVHYTPSVDLWSVGCVFAELLFNKPIFTGKNEMEQWFQIIDVCGWNIAKEQFWIQHLKDKDNLIQKMKKKSKIFNRKLKQKFTKFLNKKTAPNEKYLDENGFHLLDSLLTINPNKRISAKQALKSEWFTCDPFPKPPHLDHIQPSHDYEQRQQRKNPNYRNNNVNNSKNNSRYQYSYGNYNRNNNNGKYNGKRSIDRSRSRSRSRSRERSNNNNNNNSSNNLRSRSGSFDNNTRDNSISLPPPIQKKPPTHNTQQKQVVTLSAPSLRIGNRNQNNNNNNNNNGQNYNQNHNHNQFGGGYMKNFNPDQPHTFYSRFKRPDELKGRSRF